MLSRFETVARRRPVSLVVPGSTLADVPAPYVAIDAALGTPDGPAELAFTSPGIELAGRYDGSTVELAVTVDGRTTTHRSRRHGAPDTPPERVGLALTGPQLTVLTATGGSWTARGRVDLRERSDAPDVPDETWLESLESGSRGTHEETSGRFGQLGLRDLRLVSNADGSAYDHGEDGWLLTATSAGPGFFPTAHTSVWHLDRTTLDLEHRADLFFRRTGRSGRAGVFGDHSTHLLRDGDRWLAATSTWGDFDQHEDDATVGVTLAETTTDLTRGAHVLEALPLALPTDGLTSVGQWDPHLVHTGDEWLVGFASARRFFRFHPVLASGPDLDHLTLRGAAADRRATEGTTLARVEGAWRLLASDGKDGRRGQRERYPVFDLALTEVGELDAPYGTNIPWPTLVPDGDSTLLLGFDGTTYGGRLTGYGTHGDVVVSRSGSALDGEQRPDGLPGGVDA